MYLDKSEDIFSKILFTQLFWLWVTIKITGWKVSWKKYLHSRH